MAGGRPRDAGRTVATAIRMVRDRTRGPVPRLEFIEPAVRR